MILSVGDLTSLIPRGAASRSAREITAARSVHYRQGLFTLSERSRSGWLQRVRGPSLYPAEEKGGVR